MSLNTCNKKKRTHQEINNNIKIIDVDNEIISNQQHCALIPEVRIPNILTSSATMETAINNIRALCPQDFKLASPGLITQIHHFGLTQQQFLDGCSDANGPATSTDTIAIPTFHGDINLGHWYLAIIYCTQETMNGYIVDSLGLSQERTEYVHYALAAIDIEVTEWRYYPSIPQYELECGPRVIFHMCDIIEQIRDGVHVEFALGNTSRYTIGRKTFSTNSRLVMHNAINNCLDPDMIINVVPHDDDDINTDRPRQGGDTTKKTKQPRPTKREQTQDQIATFTVATPTINHNKEKRNSIRNVSPPHLPMIERVLTHDTAGKNARTFFFNKTGHSDDIVFVCSNKFRKNMDKKDRRIINQYLATKQGKFLHKPDMVLLQVLDKEEKLVDTKFMPRYDKEKMSIYLTKRGNGNDTIIAWETEDRATASLELKRLRKYKKGRKTQHTDPMNTFVDDDSPWGNPMTEKDENNVRICMENVNNITSMIDGNHKLDQAKAWLIKNDVDVACWIELGVPWHRRRLKEKLKSIMKCSSWNAQLTVTANNIHEETGRRQFGGTATMAFNSIVATVAGSGVDTSGLGRWSWIKLQGKHGKSTTIITAYCPCMSDSAKPETVYSQQKRFLISNNEDICPREAFRRDLSTFITKCQARYEQIIVCVDLNEDTNRENGPLQQTLLHHNELTDVLKHHHHNIPSPATHNRGSKTIDAIYVSQHLLAVDNAGWLRFGDGVGDHRIAYIDIDIALLINKNKHDIVTRTARRLQLTNRQSVHNYVRVFENNILTSAIPSRLKTFRKQHKKWGDKVKRDKLNRIDKIRVQLALKAEEKCRQIRAGVVPYAPDDVQRYGKEIRLWTLIINKKGGRKVSSKLIVRQAKRLKIDKHIKLSKEAARRLRAVAWKKYKTNKKRGSDLRDEFIERQASREEEKGNHDVADRIRSMRSNEYERDAHREVRHVHTPFGASAILHIEIPKKGNPEVMRRVTDRNQMERVMRKNFKAKFTEVYDTPIPHQPFTRIIGQDGLTKEAEEILRGNYMFPPVIHPDIVEFFHHIKMTDEILRNEFVRTDTTPEEYVNFWKQGREKISSSMSGMHNGHYIAASTSPILCSILSELASLPWEHGVSLDRWRQSLNVALEKKPGVRTLSKLRTIHLLEADFNTGTKMIFARRMMNNAYKYKLIPESQYARKYTQSIEAVVVKRLFYDGVRIYKTPGVMISNDARGCFDRIVLAIGALAMRRLGVPWTAIKSLLDTLKNMRHYIRTAHGDSDEFYTGSTTRPLQGGGQGNAAAGPMWLAISVILLSIMATLPINATIVTAISLQTLVFSAIMYVDDTDLLFLGSTSDDADTLTNKAQILIDKWCSTLWITGGCLRPDKCWWYLLDFKWHRNGTWKYATKKDSPGELVIPDHQLNEEQIERCEPHVGKETLGTYLAPDGNNVEQLNKMTQDTKQWAAQMKRGFMSKFSADLSVRTRIMKSLEYPTAAITLNETECKTIMKIILNAALPKMGINRRAGHAYLYGPSRYQGLNFPNLYTEMCAHRLITVMKHGGQPTQMGLSLLNCMEGHQLEIGTYQKMFDADINTYGHLASDSLLSHTWRLLSDCGLRLETSHAVPVRLRVRDEAIMEQIIANTEYSKKEIYDINECRIYLQVFSVADIADGDGSRITEKALIGRRDAYRTSKWHWPDRPRPPEAFWRKWRGALETAFLTTDTRSLRTRLGKWTSPTHQRWTWYIDPSETILYQDTGNGIYAHRMIGRRLRRQVSFEYKGRRHRKPFFWYKTTVDIVDNNYIYAQGYATEDTHVRRNTNDDIWRGAPDWISEELMEYCCLPTDWRNIIDAIAKKKCVAVTDGSFDPINLYSTACWIIAGETDEHRVKGAAHTPGHADDLDAYRSEVFGIYCILICLKYICERFNITTGAATIVCDCLGALTRAVIYENRPTTSHPNFDILWSIFELKDDIPIEIGWQHVYGHQDEAALGRPLSRLERLNCETDAGAKEFLTFVLTHDKRPVTKLYGTQWRLKYNDRYICKNLKHHVYMSRHGRILVDHIKKRRGYSDRQFDSIDWNAIEAAGKTLTKTEKTWLMKHVGRYNATGRQLLRRKYWRDSKCPRCQCRNEDSTHILLCTEVSATETFADGVYNLEVELNKLRTHPAIATTILFTLFDRGNSSFQSNIPTSVPAEESEIFEAIEMAASEQDQIPFEYIFEGHIVKKWNYAQAMAYRKTGNNHRSGKIWAKKIVKLLYGITRDMWNHRNKRLYDNTTASTSLKRRKTVLREVRTHIRIGFSTIRNKDKKTICMDMATLKKWTTPMLEAWLRHIVVLRKRSGVHNLKEKFDGKNDTDDDLYIQRAENLKRFSIPKFRRWRLKHHESTVAQYVRSTETLTRQLKKRRLI